MDEGMWKTLQATLRRVENAVNTRFEKDADLYIAKDDLEWLKKKLYEGNYNLVAERLKTGLKAEALTRVIIENAWLLRNDRYAPLIEVIKQCPSGYMGRGSMMASILEDRYDLPKVLRDKLAEICFAETDGHTAEAILNQGAEVLPILHNATLHLQCLNSALASLPPIEKYRRFTGYAKDKVDLYASPQWSILNEIFADDVLTKEVLDAAFHDNFVLKDAPGYKYWRRVFEERCSPDALPLRAGKTFEANSADGDVCARVWFGIAPVIKTPETVEAFFLVLRRVAPAWHRNRLDFLGQKVVNKLQEVNSEYAKTAVQICQDVGMTNVQLIEKDALPDVDAIVERLRGGELDEWNLRRMAKDFNERYWKNHQIEHLDEIRKQLDEGEREYDDFKIFCCYLAERNLKYPPYLIYVIRHFAGNETIERMLEVIKKNNLLQHHNLNRYPDEWKEVANFVRQHDFALFQKLTS